ncbi:hypothetical protein [Hydrogenivirga sp. 128-5-R1-1]|uniref:hypothetical protein n=1 Tax=Hydrogenivirga sp. 128-5-R1-1 TaxID=392423 RepID=UPI00015F338D|nr:hypothetical protein [Hydrogenivirga sp. 128-5-R1-1]EDP74858.1 hypothetical protein HG1285_13357 [Hydrogenivirga sp. 128-5-R1-1]
MGGFLLALILIIIFFVGVVNFTKLTSNNGLKVQPRQTENRSVEKPFKQEFKQKRESSRPNKPEEKHSNEMQPTHEVRTSDLKEIINKFTSRYNNSALDHKIQKEKKKKERLMKEILDIFSRDD